MVEFYAAEVAEKEAFYDITDDDDDEGTYVFCAIFSFLI